MTDEEKQFDRKEEARLDDMYDAQYEVNPAEIHTCSPQREWQRLTDEERDDALGIPYVSGFGKD